MSADPKSLATLAITSSQKKRTILNNNCDGYNIHNNDSKNDRGVKYDRQVPKFRSTDDFVAGWTAAFINTSALFPINKLIFRQMAGGHKALYAADQMKEEGEL